MKHYEEYAKQYAVEWQMTKYHTIIDMVHADSEEDAIKMACDYKGRPPVGETKVREIK